MRRVHICVCVCSGLRFIPEVSRRMGVIPQPPAINGEMVRKHTQTDKQTDVDCGEQVLERMDLADWPLRKPILVQSSLTMANYLITYLALLLSKPQFVAIGAPQDNNVSQSLSPPLFVCAICFHPYLSLHVRVCVFAGAFIEREHRQQC